jgi:hypothetical protein
MPKKLVLHAVVIQKDELTKPIADKLAKEIINDPKKTFMRTTKTQFRYRATPKTKFDPNSYKTKTIMKGVNLIFGELKK